MSVFFNDAFFKSIYQLLPTGHLCYLLLFNKKLVKTDILFCGIFLHLFNEY